DAYQSFSRSEFGLRLCAARSVWSATGLPALFSTYPRSEIAKNISANRATGIVQAVESAGKPDALHTLRAFKRPACSFDLGEVGGQRFSTTPLWTTRQAIA